jgi:hypothetical protein
MTGIHMVEDTTAEVVEIEHGGMMLVKHRTVNGAERHSSGDWRGVKMSHQVCKSGLQLFDIA